MDEDAGKVKRTYFLEETRRLRQKARVWQEINAKKEEAGRLRSQLLLLEREVESLKREAGCTAYDLWRGEIFCRDTLDALFQQICDKGVEMRRYEESIKELERQMDSLREGIRRKEKEKKREEGEKKREEGDIENFKKDKGEPAGEPVFCPNCGAEYKKMANFCRKCGARLGEDGNQ